MLKTFTYFIFYKHLQSAQARLWLSTADAALDLYLEGADCKLSLPYFWGIA